MRGSWHGQATFGSMAGPTLITGCQDGLNTEYECTHGASGCLYALRTMLLNTCKNATLVPCEIQSHDLSSTAVHCFPLCWCSMLVSQAESSQQLISCAPKLKMKPVQAAIDVLHLEGVTAQQLFDESEPLLTSRYASWSSEKMVF